MKLIRDGVFETNSSSTHTVVIPHSVDESNYELYDNFEHDYGFGRCESRLVHCWDEKLAYTYYVLKDFLDWNDCEEDNERKGMVTKESIKDFETKIINVYNSLVDTGEFNVYSHCDPTPQDIFDLVNEVDTERVKSIFGDRSWRWIGVDHTEDFATNGFVDKILSANEDYLKKFIFNLDSYITVGGDEYRGYNIKTIGFEGDYSDLGTYYVNEKGERMPEYDINTVSDEEWIRLHREYYIKRGGFWDRVLEYEKNNDVFFKGN